MKRIIKKKNHTTTDANRRNKIMLIAIIAAAVLVLAAVVVMLISLIPKHYNYTDPNAPKTIESDSIHSFTLAVDLKQSFPQEEKYDYYYMQLSYVTTETDEDGNEYPLLSPHVQGEFSYFDLETQKVVMHDDLHFYRSVFDGLQEILEKYDIAQYNGIFEWTNAQDPGASVDLAVTYEPVEGAEKGEELYCYRNDKNPLPYEFFTDVIEYIIEKIDTNDYQEE